MLFYSCSDKANDCNLDLFNETSGIILPSNIEAITCKEQNEYNALLYIKFAKSDRVKFLEKYQNKFTPYDSKSIAKGIKFSEHDIIFNRMPEYFERFNAKKADSYFYVQTRNKICVIYLLDTYNNSLWGILQFGCD
jgi:hypothetical protein